MKLSIIIPVYNEENHIGEIVPQVLNAPIDISKEIIIVDDGSTDKTTKILKKYHKNANIKIVLQPHNKGKGAAIRQGLAFASGDIILIQDADREYKICYDGRNHHRVDYAAWCCHRTDEHHAGFCHRAHP
mgnify:CR=1 FL=1